MKDPNPTDARVLIAAIVAKGKTLHYIKKLMRRHYTQIKRMSESGRCQPYEYAMLLAILEDLQLVGKPDDQVSGEQGDDTGQDRSTRNAVSLDERVASVG